jgi:hypothetical protein
MALSKIVENSITDGVVSSAKLKDFSAAVDLNGVELILDDDQDTSITADTDDRIDFKIANTDHISIGTSSGDTVIKTMTDAKDIIFQQFDGKKLLEINDGGFVAIANGASSGGVLRIYEDTDLGTLYSGFTVGNLTESYTLALPNADGSSGQALTTDGSGVLSFTTISTAYDDLTAGDAALNITTTVGNITIDAQGNDTDIIFKGTDGGADRTFMTIDGSAGGDLFLTGGLIDLKNDGSAVSNIKFYCESSNAHAQTLIGAPHSESADNVLTLPGTGGDARLVSTTSTATLTNKTLTSPKINEDVAVTATATEINLIDGGATVGTTAIADGDGLIINDAGTMRVSTVQTLAAYLDDEITAMPNLTSVGTLTALTVDNITINGNDISSTAGTDLTITPLSGQQIVLDGTIVVDAGVVTGATSITSTAFVGGLTGNVTGNASGTALTVTQAAQSAITSVGTLTALTVDDVAVDGKVITMTGSSGDTFVTTVAANGATSLVTTDAGGATAHLQITADGTVDIDGTAITLDSAGDITLEAGGSGVITLDSPGDIVLDADGADIILKDDGTTYGSLTNTSGNLIIKSGTTTAATFSGANVTLAGTVTTSTGLTKTVGKESIWVPAAAMSPTVSNGCSNLTVVETTSGRPDMVVLDFDKDSDEFAQFSVAFPKSWNAGTITFQFFWSGIAATTGVELTLAGVAFADNDSIDTAYGTAVAVADAAQGAVEELLVSAESGAITIAGSPGANELTYFRIGRDVSEDNMAGDCRLHGIKLHYTTNASNDA